MSSAALFAARVRGVAVGAASGAAALPAHGMGGGHLPSTGPLVVLVGASAAIGLLTSARPSARLTTLVAYLVAGQFAAHLMMSTTAGHLHEFVPTPTMLGGHLLVAVVVGLAARTAEHLVRVAVASIRRLLRLVSAGARPISRVRFDTRSTPSRRRGVLSSGGGTRGPPRAASLA
ncbi:hypothetical protein [Gordonia soli]|uniref:Uncharacterized protein n=1 Tax=Gordonia soli NBRC 108243 TaxID=1223545 RepID=M0QIX6_9ACTN|nr:hypothetical protein [Gordonia soli]GAC67367.1 hypothetical protein GS4_07_01160 [Gordonia soli NBRC 108243]